MKHKRKLAMLSIIISIMMVVTFASSLITATATNDNTFDQYLADYLASNENAQSYINRDYYLPYRKYVEDRRNSTYYMGLLEAWEILTFNGKAGSKVDKSIAYYETILYDAICGDIDSFPIIDSLDSTFSSTKAGTFKTVFEYCEALDEYTVVDLVELDKVKIGDNLFNELLDQLRFCEDLSGAFEILNNTSDWIENCKDFVEVVERVSALEALVENKDQMKQILYDIGISTSNVELSIACEKMRCTLDDCYNNETLVRALLGGEILGKVSDEIISDVWKAILVDVAGAKLVIAVKTGQKLGKLGAGILFSTDKDIECVYSMNALYEIEDQTVALVKKYESQYKSNPTDANAKLYNEAFKLLMRVYMEGVDYSLQYGEILNEKGIINQIFKKFNSDEYKRYVRVLNGLRDNYADYLDFIVTNVYNNWLGGIPNTKEYSKIKSRISTKKTTDVSEQDIIINLSNSAIVNDMYTNRMIDESWTLTEDVTLYGNLIINNDITIDLDGHTLNVGGDVLQHTGTINCNNGTLNISGDYVMEVTSVNNVGEINYETCYATLSMVNQYDKVNIDGNFIMHNVYPAFTGVHLEYGTFTVSGNIWSDGCIYTSAEHGARVVLNGNNKQTITLNESDKFNILVLTKSMTNYTFSHNECWNELRFVEAGSGDVDGDGVFLVTDVILLQKWLLSDPTASLPCWQAADMCKDNKLDVFDLCLMKRKLLAKAA